MICHKITLLTSGLVLDSSAIRSVKLTEQVNDQTDLCPGAACAACAEIELWAPHDVVQLQAGEEFALSRIDTDIGNEEPAGIFIAEQPTKASANVYRLDAYDRMIRLDQDFSTWLREHQTDLPMTIPDIVAAACEVCGVELAAGTMDGLPNADYQVQAFYSDGITGRQIIQWAGEAFCRFARMTADGRLEFAWYVARGYEMIGPSAELRPGYVRLADRILGTAQRELYRVQFQQQAYLQGTLSYEQYNTAMVEKVQIRQSDTDVGVVYPPDAAGTNALILQGNLLLTANSQAQLEPVAQAIWQELVLGAPVPGPNNMLVRMAGEVLAAAPDGALYVVKSSAISYTPLKVSVLATGGILPRPGDVITVTDAYGRKMVTYVMQRTISGQKVTLESTGNARRDGSTAINRAKITNTAGKIFELSIGINGLKINTEDLQQKQAQLEFDLDGLSSKVSANYDALKSYADDAANAARDEAIQSAVDQAEEAFNTELELYPTKVEMNSAISQSASEISSKVALTLEGYATKEYTDLAEQAAKDFADSAALGALNQANADTDGKLALYPTTIEMNSAITQTASQIKSEVSQTLTQYSTTEESQSYADSAASGAESAAKQYADQAAGQAEDSANATTDGKLKNYSTTIQMNSAIDQKANQITSTVNETLTQYSTTEESQKYADSAAKGAESAANAATDTKLLNYSTTIQMNSAIAQSASSINLQVSQTLTQYSTTEESEAYADQVAGAAEDAANTSTDNKLKNYSTTVQMNSAIDQKANSIILEVGQTYATKDSLSGYTKTNEVRSRFAMDPTSVTISSGRITFNSNTLVINSSNFSLNSNGVVTIRSNGDNGYVQIYDSNIIFRNNSGNSLIEIFPESASVGVIRFFNGSGGFISDIKSSVQGGQGNIQLNVSGSGFFDVNRARISELTCPDSKIYSDKYMALDGETFAQMSGSYKEILPDNLFIGKGTFRPYNGKSSLYLDWVYMNGYWVLAGFNSPH